MCLIPLGPSIGTDSSGTHDNCIFALPPWYEHDRLILELGIRYAAPTFQGEFPPYIYNIYTYPEILVT
jgi:hypothetical protein